MEANRISEIEEGFQQSEIVVVDCYDVEDKIDRRYLSILTTKPYGFVANKDTAAKDANTKYNNFDDII